MKHKITTPIILCFSIFLLSSMGMKDKTLKKAMTLKVPEGSGFNGAGVAYNPVKKLYYSAMAGNTSYPLTIFNKKGKVVSSDYATNVDVRGLWFNPTLNRLEGNPYGSTAAYFYRSLDQSGLPDVTGDIFTADEYEEEYYQPQDNSVGAFIPTTDEVVFWNEPDLQYYSRTTGTLKRTKTVTLPESLNYQINNYSVVYTGIAQSEIGIFDYQNRKIYLLNTASTTCTLSKTLVLPSKAPNPGSFNFAYCNKIFWLFDTEKREWVGYK